MLSSAHSAILVVLKSPAFLSTSDLARVQVVDETSKSFLSHALTWHQCLASEFPHLEVPLSLHFAPSRHELLRCSAHLRKVSLAEGVKFNLRSATQLKKLSQTLAVAEARAAWHRETGQDACVLVGNFSIPVSHETAPTSSASLQGSEVSPPNSFQISDFSPAFGVVASGKLEISLGLSGQKLLVAGKLPLPRARSASSSACSATLDVMAASDSLTLSFRHFPLILDGTTQMTDSGLSSHMQAELTFSTLCVITVKFGEHRGPRAVLARALNLDRIATRAYG
mmetsp:Transcript_66241/g.144407  ORF Transcript_66241/g.144407 Transcript_66241/m.144407 type:complete len:282 (+) Transcript_66241:69-914(+)